MTNEKQAEQKEKVSTVSVYILHLIAVKLSVKNFTQGCKFVMLPQKNRCDDNRWVQNVTYYTALYQLTCTIDILDYVPGIGNEIT